MILKSNIQGGSRDRDCMVYSTKKTDRHVVTQK